MNKPSHERHLLLNNENSDEELFVYDSSPKFQRRLRCSISGRARTNAKGAASIIIQWPDHLSSVLAYWWIGIGMITLLIFVIYNIMTIVTTLPPTHPRPLKSVNGLVRNKNVSQKNFYEKNVYMHLFVSSYEDAKINNYIPYIEAFSAKYSNFTYNFIVVINDVSKDSIDDLSDELNNEMAMNSLWNESKNSGVRFINKKLTIQVISLTKYMDKSPLKKYWRRLPEQFIGFLIRCIAIWNKGGIALNPIILTPMSSNSKYAEKIQQIFGSAELGINRPYISKSISKKHKMKVNNIRDIINTLEKVDYDNNMGDNMLEAENVENIYTLNNELKLTNHETHDSLDRNYTDNQPESFNKLKYENEPRKPNDEGDYLLISTTKINETKTINGITSKQSLLPMFLEYLFHPYPKNISEINIKTKNDINNITHNDVVISDVPIVLNISEQMTPEDKIKIIPKDSITHKKHPTLLTVDLTGNLIATETPCHAFIGTIFSNVIHHTNEETIKDFIISELSIFCKGTLSSCQGIEVILL